MPVEQESFEEMNRAGKRKWFKMMRSMFNMTWHDWNSKIPKREPYINLAKQVLKI